jgi:CBS domain-containing protein
MDFTVREWMNELVVFIEPDATVADALALMRRRYIHSLIIHNRELNEYGILTSTDISDKIVAQDRNPSAVKVREIMTSPVLTVPQGSPLKNCAMMMREHRIHHLPVADSAGKIIGMISSTDFLVAAEAMGRPPGERLT